MRQSKQTLLKRAERELDEGETAYYRALRLVTTDLTDGGWIAALIDKHHRRIQLLTARVSVRREAIERDHGIRIL